MVQSDFIIPLLCSKSLTTYTWFGTACLALSDKLPEFFRPLANVAGCVTLCFTSASWGFKLQLRHSKLPYRVEEIHGGKLRDVTSVITLLFIFNLMAFTHMSKKHLIPITQVVAFCSSYWLSRKVARIRYLPSF